MPSSVTLFLVLSNPFCFNFEITEFTVPKDKFTDSDNSLCV